MADMRVDPERADRGEDLTGIYVRAIGSDGRWGSFDMAQLDRASFVQFATQGGAVPTWALSILLHLMGHPVGVPEGGEPQ